MISSSKKLLQMVGGCSSLSYSSSSTFIATTTLSSSLKLNPQSFIFHLNLRKPAPLRCASSLTMESPKPILDFEKFDDGFVQKLVYDALVWSSLHGLVVGDKTHQVKFLSFDVGSCVPTTFDVKVKIFESRL